MKIAAVDYGKKRIGVALCDEGEQFARPAGTVSDPSPRRMLAQTADLILELGAKHILVGLPRHMNGTEGESAAAARSFADALKARLKLPVELVDERLSTVQASRLMHEAGRNSREQKGSIDAASAVVMLQSWLDSRAAPDGFLEEADADETSEET